MTTNVMKKRFLYLMKLLYERTDENHPLNTNEIIAYLNSVGCSTERKTLKSDIDLLIDFGIDIVFVKSSPNKYYWGERTIPVPEMSMLIDAIMSSQVITAEQSEELTAKLMTFVSTYQAQKFRELLEEGEPLAGAYSVSGADGDAARVTVELECAEDTREDVVKQFGKAAELRCSVPPRSGGQAGRFIARVEAAADPAFYAWVFRFGGKIRITAPEHAVTGYRELAVKALHASDMPE